MATNVTIVLRKKPNKSGLYPLAIRITSNRVPKYSQIGQYIKLEDWNENERTVKSSHPDAYELNELIAKKLYKVRKHLNSTDLEKGSMPAFKKKDKAKKVSDFFEIAQQFLNEFETAENYQRLSVESGLLSYIKRFHKQKTLPFEIIDESFLKKLKIHLKKEHSLAETSIMNVFVQIRTLYNRAINKGIVKQKYYPFGKNRIKIKFPETQKIGLNKEEILALESLTDMSYREQHALNVWLYSFNFAGMRVSDVLRQKWSDFKDGRLYYRMKKNSKLVSLKVPHKIFEILDFYKGERRYADDYIFPDIKKADLENPKDVYRALKVGNKRINVYLKILAQKAGIEKNLTMHIARHSFGHIAGENIHPKKLQKLYRHGDLKTTLNYQSNFIHAETDEALDSVVNF